MPYLNLIHNSTPTCNISIFINILYFFSKGEQRQQPDEPQHLEEPPSKRRKESDNEHENEPQEETEQEPDIDMELERLAPKYEITAELVNLSNTDQGNILNFIFKTIFQTYRPLLYCCLLYTSPSPRDATLSRMPSSA